MHMRGIKGEGNGQIDVPEGAESVRLADVLTFLEVYAKADTAKMEDRANFSKLLSIEGEKKGLTTRIGQLERIVEFLYGKDEVERSGLYRLFEKDPTGGLVPSADARKMHKHFVILRDVYRNIKAEIAKDRSGDSTPVLRLGAPQTVGIRLLAAILSDWRRLFPDGTQQKIEIATSHDAIRRLKSRLLDVVIAYGPKIKPGWIDPQTGLAFRSLGYNSRMVLLCHPAAPLWTRGRKDGERRDANRGYWKESYQDKNRRELPSYDDLRRVDLRTVDLTDTRLIAVDSWQQPEILDTFIRGLPPDRVVRVPWYDEALALVRMGEGVAVTSEVFSKRARVTAFGLDPKSEFERWIGAYFHPPEDRLPNHVRKLIRIVETYLDYCKDEVRLGEPPCFGDLKYEQFCVKFATPSAGDGLP